MLDAACAWKLGSLAFKLLAGASKALDHEAVATFLEIGATSVEAGEALHDRQRDIVRTAAGRLQVHIERNSDEWLRAEFGSDPSGRADAAAAIAALGDILPKCLPDGLKVAQANLDTERIAGLVVAKAGAGDEMFRKDTFGERLLRCLVQRAYEEAKRDRDFAAVIGIPVQQVLLERTDALLAGQAELPDAIVSRLVAALDMRRAESGGLERETIIKIARRLRPDEMLDFDQAVVELERAVDVALDVIARGERGTNYDAFVDLVLAKVAEKTRLGDFDGGAQAVDEALIDLDRREAEQRDIFRRSRVALLEAGVDQDILRRDASAVAPAHRGDRRGVRTRMTAQPGRRHFANDTTASTRKERQRGANFSLSVAIELARRMVASARNADERGVAGNLLGVALWTLGERESGTARLEEAVAAYRAALEERTRDRVPLDWAMTQNNLGSALRTLGARESGTARLEEAVAAYRAALAERTRDRVPLDWAMTQNNLGAALATLGERESGTARLEEAVAAYRAALAERTRDRVPLQWAMTQNNLGIALATLGERESGTARLEEAVAAYRAALAERTRDRVPLDWAMTQNNLGNALRTLGARESGTARLEEAVAAYRAALAGMDARSGAAAMGDEHRQSRCGLDGARRTARQLVQGARCRRADRGCAGDNAGGWACPLCRLLRGAAAASPSAARPPRRQLIPRRAPTSPRPSPPASGRRGSCWAGCPLRRWAGEREGPVANAMGRVRWPTGSAGAGAPPHLTQALSPRKRAERERSGRILPSPPLGGGEGGDPSRTRWGG